MTSTYYSKKIRAFIDLVKIYKFKFKQELKIDTEIIADLFNQSLNQNEDLKVVTNSVLSVIEGTASCVVHLADKGKLILFTNNYFVF